MRQPISTNHLAIVEGNVLMPASVSAVVKRCLSIAHTTIIRSGEAEDRKLRIKKKLLVLRRLWRVLTPSRLERRSKEASLK